MEACLPNLRRHWMRGLEMSAWVVLVPDFEAQLALYAKRTRLNCYFDSIEKRDFL